MAWAGSACALLLLRGQVCASGRTAEAQPRAQCSGRLADAARKGGIGCACGASTWSEWLWRGGVRAADEIAQYVNVAEGILDQGFDGVKGQREHVSHISRPAARACSGTHPMVSQVSPTVSARNRQQRNVSFAPVELF